MMREKLDDSKEWKAVTSDAQREACAAAVANAVAWFDEEVGFDTNTSQVHAHWFIELCFGFIFV
jgi:hypothetical protein